MTIKYFAEDGTEFDSEWECEDYEKTTLIKSLGIVSLYADYSKCKEIGEATFVYVPSVKALNFLDKHTDFGYLSVGWNIFDDEYRDEFVSFKAILKRIEKAHAQLLKIGENLKEYNTKSKVKETE